MMTTCQKKISPQRHKGHEEAQELKQQQERAALRAGLMLRRAATFFYAV
jgi:hypothetical protein